VFVWTDERIQGHFTLCYLVLCLVRYIQYLYTEECGETISAERIQDCLCEASVVFVGEFPKTSLVPVNISEDYLRLHKLIGLKPLKKAMTIAQFRSTKKLDPMINAELMKDEIGQFKKRKRARMPGIWLFRYFKVLKPGSFRGIRVNIKRCCGQPQI